MWNAACDGREYAGSFDASLPFSAIVLLFAACAAAMVPMSILAVEEEPVRSGADAREYARGTWAQP